MSHQRAVVNCRICYSIFRGARSGQGMNEFSLSQQRITRNETMLALENEIDIFKDSRAEGHKGDCINARNALTICMECDYQQASVVEYYLPAVNE